MLDKNLKTLRLRKGFSQEELAIRLNVVRQTVSKWEKGLSVPDAQMLIRIAEELDTTVNTLLGAPVEEPMPEDAVSAISARLEQLNEQFARYTERRRRIIRAVCIILTALALLGLGAEIVAVVYHHQVNAALTASEAIIGGADEPTSVLLTSAHFQGGYAALLMLLLIAACIGLVRTRRK